MTAPTELTDDYLAAGQCVTVVVDAISDTAPAGFGPVPCDSRSAVARVTSRSRTTLATAAVRAVQRPACEDTTDFVLDLGPNLVRASGGIARPGMDEAYACLRNLNAPHPGDPGQGGGPMIGVGDCVVKTTSTGGKAIGRETKCDGTGGSKPEYKVVKVVTTILVPRGATPDKCAPGTAFEFPLRADDRSAFGPFGCADKL
ncbi:hypothetical protein ACIQ9P_21660 [Kitasatospora sp. NPDC094019]|uniref:hypothetical protein n=1 Tax=Kitasatospora sp. NPDC094019 TaxID=3364091 RepID=UPI0038155444